MAAPAPEGPRVRVAALITLAGRVVLVRHRAGSSVYHLLPGGGVGYRETLAEALVREVTEETGLVVSLGIPLFISDTIDPEGPRHVVNITFSAEVVGGQVTHNPTDHRVVAVDLVEPSRLPSLDLRPPIAQYVLEAIESDGTPQLQYLGSLFTVGQANPTPGDS